MSAPGIYHRTHLGQDPFLRTAVGPTTYAMAALDVGWAARFTADDTRDVKAVYIGWGTVTAPGSVAVRIETIDATTGKPSGTLYDANAAVTITPSSAGANGFQLCTFAVLPTTGLVAGTEYALVLLTTVAGTAHTLRSHVAANALPTVALQAAVGTTRSNFAEVSGTPCCTFVMEDDVEETLGCSPVWAVAAPTIYAARAEALKFVVPTGMTWDVLGINAFVTSKTGTPGNLRFRILPDGSSATVAGTQVDVDKDSASSIASRDVRVRFPSPVSLAAGTYRAVVEQADHATTSGNNYTIRSVQSRAAGLVPSGLVHSSTTDLAAGTITWTDAGAEQPNIWLILDGLTATGGGGTPPAPGDVRLGVDVGDGETEGTLALPAESQVALGVGFGADGTELTGAMEPGGGAGGINVAGPQFNATRDYDRDLDVALPATLGPWQPIGTRTDFTCYVINGAEPPTTACSFALDVSADGGESFTTTGATAAGLAAGTTYTLIRSVAAASGTHARARITGNVGGDAIEVRCVTNGTLAV